MDILVVADPLAEQRDEDGHRILFIGAARIEQCVQRGQSRLVVALGLDGMQRDTGRDCVQMPGNVGDLIEGQYQGVHESYYLWVKTYLT